VTKLYRKRPVIVRCEEWRSNSAALDFSGVVSAAKITPFRDERAKEKCDHCGKSLLQHGLCPTLEGNHIVCPGDIIIEGVRGEFYPCKPDIFTETYEEVDDEV